VTTVDLATRDGVAVLTLNRPDAHNTISLELARDLDEATRSIRDVGAVLLTAAGKTFCAGGDLRAFAAQPSLPDHLRQLTAHLHPAIARIDALDVPVVAAVRGAAAGAGLGLACAADIVLVSPDARFVSAYTAIGLSPDGSVSWSLPRIVGMRRALELVLTNRVLDAEEAVAWGIATRVVDDDALDAEAMSLAAGLASGARKGLGGARRLVRDSFRRTLEGQLEAETQTLVASAADYDAAEGITAFLDKRAPRYRESK
jgi:2-(1,2-epoxy-1,2-dihydrophenyl)acetyl-CoA isomerase